MSKIPVVFALSFVSVAVACGGGDPGQGSSTGPLAAPAQASATSDEGGVVDAARIDAAPILASAVEDAGDAASSAPSFGNPAPWDGGCVSPNMTCNGADDAGPACVAVTSDVDNCGACGHACAGPSATCVGGECACSQLGFLYCSAAGCIDTTSDVNNCGACGNVCDPSQFDACVGSLCVSQ